MIVGNEYGIRDHTLTEHVTGGNTGFFQNKITASACKQALSCVCQALDKSGFTFMLGRCTIPPSDIAYTLMSTCNQKLSQFLSL